MASAVPLGSILADTSPASVPGPESLIGKHITLERLQIKHAAELYAAIGNKPDLWKHIPAGPFASQAEFADYVQKKVDSPQHAFYAIVLQSTGKVAGYVGLWGPSTANRVTEIGPVMYGPDLARSRAGTEVLSLLGTFVFEELGYRRWEWRFNSLNEASRRAAERYGFMYEGRLRQHMIVKGRNRDTCIYSLVDTEWPRCKEVFETWLTDGNFDEKGKQRKSLDEIREVLSSQKKL